MARESTYTEPIVFDSSGSTLTLVNYKYAYGNRMSDSEDHPYSVDTAVSGNSGSSYTDYRGGGDFEMAADVSMEEGMIADWGGGYYGYYYYGGYNYYYDPFVERTYKTSADSRGYYTY